MYLGSSVGACRHVRAGAIGLMQGVLVPTGEAAGGRPVGVHLAMSIPSVSICIASLRSIFTVRYTVKRLLWDCSELVQQGLQGD